jgi:hypothetical protein
VEGVGMEGGGRGGREELEGGVEVLSERTMAQRAANIMLHLKASFMAQHRPQWLPSAAVSAYQHVVAPPNTHPSQNTHPSWAVPPAMNATQEGRDRETKAGAPVQQGVLKSEVHGDVTGAH